MSQKQWYLPAICNFLPASEGSIRPVCQELPLLSFRRLPILPPSPSLFGHETHHCVDTTSHESHSDVLTLCIMHLLRALLLGGCGCSFWQSLSVSLHHTPSRRKSIISDHSAQHQHQCHTHWESQRGWEATLGTAAMSARPTKNVCSVFVRRPAKAHEAPFTPFSVCQILLVREKSPG